MTTTCDLPRLAFIGLGTMGAPMARHLHRAGYPLAVYDKAEALTEPFRTMDGCRVGNSAADAAESAEVLITMLPTSRHVASVLFDDGAVERLPAGSLVIDMSTSDPDEQDEVARRLRQQGVRFVDAPVCRGRAEAEAGRLLGLVGGDAADVEAARAILAPMCEHVIATGAAGSAIRLKLVNNYLSMVHMVLAAEGLTFAAKLGIARETALDLFSRTPAGKGQLLTNFPRKVLSGDVSPDFPLRMGLKDLSLAMKLGAAVGTPLMLGGAAREFYALAEPWGRGGEDCTAMLLLIEDLARVPAQAGSAAAPL
ncbi:NAD(P)-dependent oxidoreductase [Mangrovicella endophytica]|uniref:NAD(P)-dependent oxidoreductase n=1 Tax=Mangrovicella endophytica TaxID=2066697 RepID=UPI000C9E6E72|nr:NAD(P)-dependent oxidoreductase [Mangrovicella endophytica]